MHNEALPPQKLLLLGSVSPVNSMPRQLVPLWLSLLFCSWLNVQNMEKRYDRN